jgi:hypothetical protein
MGDVALTRRWRDGDGPALAARIIDRLVAGEPLASLPLDRHEGRFAVDLLHEVERECAAESGVAPVCCTCLTPESDARPRDRDIEDRRR